MHHTIWASSRESPFLPYANNKGADQPAHPHSLISAFVVRCIDSIPLVFIHKISSLYLVSVCWFETVCWFESTLVANPEDRFSRDGAHMWGWKGGLINQRFKQPWSHPFNYEFLWNNFEHIAHFKLFYLCFRACLSLIIVIYYAAIWWPLTQINSVLFFSLISFIPQTVSTTTFLLVHHTCWIAPRTSARLETRAVDFSRTSIWFWIFVRTSRTWGSVHNWFNVCNILNNAMSHVTICIYIHFH